MNAIEVSVEAGKRALNEYDAKLFLAEFGIPVSREILVPDENGAVKAAQKIGYPVVLKAVGEKLQHKTELGAIALNVKLQKDVQDQARRLLALPSCEYLLVQEMVKGDRELVCGLTRDIQFGPCVMFGQGGIFTELINDVVFRVAPVSQAEAADMIKDTRMSKILQSFRGQPSLDLEAMTRIIVALGEIGLKYHNVKEIDINPIKIRPDGSPVAVDALVALQNTAVVHS